MSPAEPLYRSRLITANLMIAFLFLNGVIYILFQIKGFTLYALLIGIVSDTLFLKAIKSIAVYADHIVIHRLVSFRKKDRRYEFSQVSKVELHYKKYRPSQHSNTTITWYLQEENGRKSTFNEEIIFENYRRLKTLFDFLKSKSILLEVNSKIKSHRQLIE